MTQNVTKTVNPADALSTLADNTSVTIETAYSALDEPTFLFEYEASGIIVDLDINNDMMAGNGGSIVLVRSDISDADIDTELSAFTLTKTTKASGRYLEHQRVFEVATLAIEGTPASGIGAMNWHLRFAPKKKGGIPFNEGSGWKLAYINRSGSAMTTGALVKANSVRQRFAFGGY